MPKLKVVIDKLDEVAETFRDLYTEGEDGKFHLDADIEDTTGLKSALDKERKARREAEKRVKDLPEGFDADEWKQWKEGQARLEEEKAKAKGDWEAREKQLVDRHAKEVEKREQRIAKLQQAIERHLIDATATQAIADQKGSAKLLLPHVRSQVKVVEEDGEYQVVVIDEKGHPRIGEKSDRMTIGELVAELKTSDDYAGAFQGSGASGGGATSSRSGGAAPRTLKNPSPAELGRFAEQIAKGEIAVEAS